MRNLAVPDEPLTVEEARFHSTVGGGRVNLLALLEAVPAGAAFCGVITSQLDSVDGEAGIRVGPAARGHGVGSALFTACVGRLRELGKQRMRITVREDEDDALRLLEARGFVEVSRMRQAVLDLATLPSSRVPVPDGDLGRDPRRPSGPPSRHLGGHL